MQLRVDGQETYVYTGARAFDARQASVVFIHGAALDHSVWVLQSRYFAHHGRNALAVDLPGHGRSRGEPCGGIGGYADWIARFLAALEVEEAALCGHSMGALVALEAAANHPDRISKLALIGVSTPMPVSDELLEAARAGEHAAFDMINVWGHALGHFGGHRAPGMWMMGGALRLLERSAPGVLLNDLRACNEYRHGVEAGAKVRCPALMVLGELDMMSSPRNAQDLAKAIEGVRVVVLPRCGHMLMAERPDEVLDALIEFVPSRKGAE